MERNRERKSRFALTVSFFILSLFFLICASAWFILSVFSRSIEDNLEKVYKTQAQSVGEQIGSQFFERYGDVQAMAQAASLALDVPNSKKRLVELLNRYARLYRLYDFIMVVDMTGQIIAVNSEDVMGGKLTPAMFSAMDVKHADWFAKPVAGIFTEDRGRNLQGTFFYLQESDPEVVKIYNDKSVRALFSALIYKNNRPVGVIVSHSRLDWLTLEVQEQYRKFIKLGMGSSAIRVIDGAGKVLAGYGTQESFADVKKTDEGILIEAPIESPRFPMSLDWRVQIFSPRSDVRQFVQYWKIYYILLASIFFVVSAMVTVYFGRRFKLLALEYEQAIAAQTQLEDRVQERTQALEENIREIKIMQNQMIAQEKMAGLGIMATGLAHEIKNPLNIVLNSAQFLKDYYLPDDASKVDVKEAREFTDMIVKHSERIDSLIKTILMSAHRDSKLPEVVDVNELISESLQILLKTFQIQHQVAMPAELKTSRTPANVKVDIEELRRVILNLMDNSIYSLWRKWGKENIQQALLKIQIETLDKQVRITVEDNGLGIPEAEKKNIFTPFFTTKEPGQGTGLGLVMSADILKKYSGTIRFESEENKYCRFYIELPMHKEPV
ncbi:sensor histidine kinase [Bdellovibrio svalbardensis]|uniref:histidine kinase n=1 Tax=Bdellovibrio svalbardensis TaxID=2972972 RepID=A0ABT6DFZ6_9BACT|nr:sensor histidine kinase [Bdellovibrio svalbardensis]MDG0815775.1 sensor histidine kinase [Bdellovibrio svalbardensis]